MKHPLPASAGVAPHPRVWIGEDEGQTALLVEGVVQSVLVEDGPLGPGYWPLMMPDFTPGRCLILGMGGGTIAHLLRRRFGSVQITGVEHDPDIIRLARSAFGLAEPAFEIVQADAFEFVSAESTSFDYVAVDLFAGDIPARIFSRPFLKDVKRLLTPGGLAAINFFRDRRTAARLRRLATVFPHVTVQNSRKNVVAHCRPR